MSTHTASDKQFAFLDSLIRERGSAVGVLDPAAFMETVRVERLTSEGAKEVIDRLLSTPKPQAAGAIKVNRYGGKCVLCGVWVAEEAGQIRKDGARWSTLHLPGQCQAVKATEVISTDSKTSPSWDSLKAVSKDEFPDGGYAVPSLTGNNDLTFFSVKTNKGFYDSSRKGQRIFKHVVGGGNEYAVTPSFFFRAMEAAKTVGIRESHIAYGQHLGVCGRCGADLTDLESRQRGLGPECFSK